MILIFVTLYHLKPLISWLILGSESVIRHAWLASFVLGSCSLMFLIASNDLDALKVSNAFSIRLLLRSQLCFTLILFFSWNTFWSTKRRSCLTTHCCYVDSLRQVILLVISTRSFSDLITFAVDSSF